MEKERGNGNDYCSPESLHAGVRAEAWHTLPDPHQSWQNSRGPGATDDGEVSIFLLLVVLNHLSSQKKKKNLTILLANVVFLQLSSKFKSDSVKWEEGKGVKPEGRVPGNCPQNQWVLKLRWHVSRIKKAVITTQSYVSIFSYCMLAIPSVTYVFWRVRTNVV